MLTRLRSALTFVLMALRSPSSSISYGFTYDVFISFRGTDTRFCFTGNLYKALCDRGIRTFIDDRELHAGDEIRPSLFKNIEDSRIAVLVLSINYASSSFCLDELIHIIHCFKAKGRLVLPVFYGVDPSHVRHQTGSYGKAIAEHEERFQNNKEKYMDNMKRLLKWKMALNQAANLSGYHFNTGNGYEHEVIEKIVKEVCNKINRTPLHVADYPIGLESRVLQVKSLLDVGSDDGVCMVGICGTAGMGKSTLARATFNVIADQFECLCFLDDVREKEVQHGLVYLQERLLYETVREKDIDLGSVNKGISIIKQRLHRKKILLILDDVDKLKQLQVMVGEPNWFGLGSRVIITTRDKHLLASHGIERTYELDGLNKDEALELLRWKAFKNKKVHSSYEDILNRAVTYASGLPLALEVVGSNLFGKHVEEWKSLLDQYERIPSKEIQKILKVSFDALEEDEKSVFLDIACCFKGYESEEVEDILGAHYGQCMKYHMGVLVDKSLIKICQWVTLHDLIEDMGKEIVRQESPKEAGKRSRLWFHKDIVQVLEENMGTSQIEIIYLDFPLSEEENEKEVEWNGDELKKMENLKTLIIKNGNFSKGPELLPNNLRVLEWHRYPSLNIPSDFLPKKLFICKLGKSCLTSCEFPGPLKKFVNLRELNLDNCDYLTQIFDISGLQNLEKLSFENCQNLIRVDNSVGFLNKLKILNATGCWRLRSFPSIKLTSLQHLKLSHCTSLKSFPEILGKMEDITKILLMGTSIEELPFSFQNLTQLDTLHVEGRGMLRLPSNILMMPKLSWIVCEGCHLLPKQSDKMISMVSSNLQILQLQNCNLSDEFLPIVLPWFANVEDLNLSGNNFIILPECIKECRLLRNLVLDDCKCLQEIRRIPSNLKGLSALHCKSLTSQCRNMLLSQVLHEDGDTMFCLAGTARIPDWFDHQSKGLSISFWFRTVIPSMALFIVSKSMHNKCLDDEFFKLRTKLFINGHKCVLDWQYVRFLEIRPYHSYLFDLQLLKWGLRSKLYEALLKNEWIHVEVTCNGSMMKSLFTEIGIHVFKQKSSTEDIQFANPYENREN